MKKYCFIQYRKEMNLPDGIYNGLYNKEPTIIRLRDRIPVWVQFIGFMKDVGDGQDGVRRSCIFDARGIMHSNVELLLPAPNLFLYEIEVLFKKNKNEKHFNPWR